MVQTLHNLLASIKKISPICKDGLITASDFTKLIGVCRPMSHECRQMYKKGPIIAESQ